MKNVNRLVSKVLVAMTAIVAICGCEPATTPEQEIPAGTAPRVLLDVSTLDVDYDGGEYGVQYSIENGIDGVDILPVTEQKWVKDLASDGTTLSFAVDFNNTFEVREATVELRYPSMSTPTLLTIRQAAMADVSFSISAKSVTTMSCSYEVTPADDSMTYILMFDSAEYMKNNAITTLEELYANDYGFRITDRSLGMQSSAP